MRTRVGIVITLIATVASVVIGVAVGSFVPMASWRPAIPGILVALSLLAGAVLVRMARNAPITAINAFDETDLAQFFDTLEELTRRLFFILIQVVVTIVLVVTAAIKIGDPGQQADGGALLSGLLAGSLAWLLFKLTQLAWGDIGFVRLQRDILERALRRERRKEVAKVVVSKPATGTKETFGRQL